MANDWNEYGGRRSQKHERKATAVWRNTARNYCAGKKPAKEVKSKGKVRSSKKDKDDRKSKSGKSKKSLDSSDSSSDDNHSSSSSNSSSLSEGGSDPDLDPDDLFAQTFGDKPG